MKIVKILMFILILCCVSENAALAQGETLPEVTDDYIPYTMEKDDTISDIAMGYYGTSYRTVNYKGKKHNVISAIEKANNVRATRLKAGREIKLPTINGLAELAREKLDPDELKNLCAFRFKLSDALLKSGKKSESENVCEVALQYNEDCNKCKNQIENISNAPAITPEPAPPEPVPPEPEPAPPEPEPAPEKAELADIIEQVDKNQKILLDQLKVLSDKISENTERSGFTEKFENLENGLRQITEQLNSMTSNPDSEPVGINESTLIAKIDKLEESIRQVRNLLGTNPGRISPSANESRRNNPVRNSEGRYTIRPGDTLSEISDRVYGTSRLARCIASANETIGDINLIFSGNTILIPGRENCYR